MKIKEFIRKLQNLPEEQKKIILYAVAGIAAVILSFFWLDSVKRNLKKIDSASFLPPVNFSLDNPDLQDKKEKIKDAGLNLDQMDRLQSDQQPETGTEQIKFTPTP